MTLPQGKYDISTLEKLLFRRQFILGPHFIEDFSSWKRIKVRDNICLTVHPDLNRRQTVYRAKSITLLGYILDPNDPLSQDQDIIDSLVRKLDTCDGLDNFFQYTYMYGGRWILIVDNGQEIRLFNDPAGFRQLFYTDFSFSSNLWCASQPGMIAQLMNLTMDKKALGFITNYESKGLREYWWPGDTSPFKGIKHLLPNHYLDLEKGSYHRFWPHEDLKYLSLEEGIERTSAGLKGLMKSAFNRFKLSLTITAGWDSRLLLAASREVSHKIYYFSMLRGSNDRDVIIPSRLLPKLGLKYNIMRYPARMDNEFKKIYNRNVVTAHSLWGRMAQGLFDCYPQDRVCVKGNACEIARGRQVFTLPEPENGNVTSQKLAWLMKMEDSPFVIKAFNKWLSEVPKTYNIKLLDLFYWEQRMGNWQAMSQLEWDIVQEVLAPFNCRALLIDMLSVDQEYRDPPGYQLYHKVILNLWPEVLEEPINPRISPQKKSTKLTVRLPRILKRIRNSLSQKN